MDMDGHGYGYGVKDVFMVQDVWLKIQRFALRTSRSALHFSIHRRRHWAFASLRLIIILAKDPTLCASRFALDPSPELVRDRR